MNECLVLSSCVIVSQLQKELERLTELKKANMKLLILNTRTALHDVWDKCHYGESQRREFKPAFSDSYGEDVLGDLESELDRMNGFYRDNKDLFQKVEKREKMWTHYQELVVSYWYKIATLYLAMQQV